MDAGSCFESALCDMNEQNQVIRTFFKRSIEVESHSPGRVRVDKGYVFAFEAKLWGFDHSC